VLSPAEQGVAAHLCRGLNNREIAAILGKSPATVKNQVSTILRKLRAPARLRLLALLQQSCDI
jgi:DNA-binding CsgD family transcriptional regulator